ncbi:MAG: methyl-accepting chemotaxis protein [Aeromonadaceae bacterium]
MKIKTKIVNLAAIPLILVVCIMNASSYWTGLSLLEQEQAQMEKDLLQGRQQLLDQYLKLAQSAIAKTYAAEDTPANREAVKSILRDLRYAEDGYFFVYDFNGVNQVLGPKPEMEGKDLSGLKDADGKPFIKNIIEAARSGDGFTQYLWDKPSVKKAVEKLSLSRTLDKYQWVLGTGFYIDDIETELAAQRSAAESGLHAELQQNLIISCIMLLVTIALTAWIGNRISHPLEEVVDALNDIASGEGDLTRRLKSNGDDEVGRLSRAFNQFVGQIQDVVSQVGGTSQHVFELADRLKTASGQFIDQMQGHRRETEQVVTAVTEMSSTAQEVASSAANAATATSAASHEAADAQGVVATATRSINDLVGEVDQASQVIGQLEQETSKIGSVVEVIRGIAEQTNLLALNAAIEAARAGEQGRGFAVVADEVRSLAGRTQQSTLEINSMLQRLQAGVAQAVQVMDTSQERSQQTVQETSKIAHSLDGVATAVDTINEMNLQIATAAEEQNAVSEEINRNLVAIQHIVEQLALAAEDSERSTRDLADTGHQLNDLVSRFRY